MISCQPEIEPVAQTDRCSGQCCKSFSLPFTHEQIDAWKIIGIPDFASMFKDIEMIVTMAIPLEVGAGGIEHFSCAHFDGANCGIYEARPAMCSDFPYGRRCPHGKLCTWDKARTGEHGYKDRSRLRLRVLS